MLLNKEDAAFYLDYYLREPEHCCPRCGTWIVRGPKNDYAREKQLLEICIWCNQKFGKWISDNIYTMMEKNENS